MTNIVYELKMTEEFIDYIQRLYYEYSTRKDIIDSIFDLHKFDDDALVLKSKPFQHYEQLFLESKVAYDHAMEEIQKEYIPEQYRSERFRFEVIFDEELIRIYDNE